MAAKTRRIDPVTHFPRRFKPMSLRAKINHEPRSRGRQSAHFFSAAQSQPTAVDCHSSETRIPNLLARAIFPALVFPRLASRIPLHSHGPATPICPKLHREKIGKKGAETVQFFELYQPLASTFVSSFLCCSNPGLPVPCPVRFPLAGARQKPV